MKISSYTADGLSSGNTTSMTLSIRNTNGITKVTKKSSGSGRKKQLNYNPKEISSAILKAKKAQSAGRVLVQAKGKLSSLLKCKGTGQYNESELNIAIIHARRMVQCARMKTQNLRQEERSKKRYENEAKAELRQEKSEAKARAARKEHALEQKNNIERMQRIQKQKREKRELMRKKKFHRSQEQSKVCEADMDYLKKQIRGLREPYSASSYTGATLDLSAEAMQLSELQMEQQMTEAQIEQEIEQQMAVEAGMEATSAPINGGTGMSDGAAVAAAATSIDISI